MIRQFLPATVGTLSLIGSMHADAPGPIETVDAWMRQAMERLHIPGIAVAVVKEGQIVMLKGYGLRDVSHASLPVTEQTLFAIGSCSKAFTAFALGQLADEGQLAWDDPVIKHIPEFRLSDIYATHHLTVKDLVAHRTGYPRHDFVWYGSTEPRVEILKRLPYLAPQNGLREQFQYNNLMYTVAGLVVERITGQSWEEVVQKQIFDPIGMNHANFSVDASQKSADFALPHSERDSQVTPIPFRNLCIVGPAGSINASVADMAKWVQLQLAEGVWGGKPLVRKETLQNMHRVHMPLEYPGFEETPYVFGYGLGWMTGLHQGHYTVTHGGGIDGFICSVALFPKEKVGVVVLTNSDRHGLLPTYAAYAIADLFMGKEEGKWLARVEEREKQIKEALKQDETTPAGNTMLRPLGDYLGEFEHPGCGTVRIFEENDGLHASLNGNSYRLNHKCYDHFFSEYSEVLEYKINCFFASNDSGEIAEFHLSAEPALPPIVFKRKAPNELLSVDYLKKFIGTFEGPAFSMEIALKKNCLTATVPGQPSCEMKPEKQSSFSLKEVSGCKLQFTTDAAGKASELQVHQLGQTFTLKSR
jgi:CubicO group peptidase (beta-lactamase class C family)